VKQTALFERPAQSRVPFAIRANIDGGARGNPGPAACAVVVRNEKSEVIAEWGEYLGVQTNNVAEYSGLLAALDYAVREKYPSFKVLSDSELLVRQMRGVYKVKNPQLRELFDRAQTLARKIEHFGIEYVPREQNREADRLVNKILDSQARRR
jgi:ribonuclease HI